MTHPDQYRGLRIFLNVLAILVSLGGVLLIFGTKWFVSWAEMVMGASMSGSSELTASLGSLLVVWLLKSLGAIAVGLGFLLYRASRDPVRYVGVIDAFAVILVLLAAIDIYGILALGLGNLYAPALIWGRAAVRLLLAAALVALRPLPSKTS